MYKEQKYGEFEDLTLQKINNSDVIGNFEDLINDERNQRF